MNIRPFNMFTMHWYIIISTTCYISHDVTLGYGTIASPLDTCENTSPNTKRFVLVRLSNFTSS